MKLVYNGKMLNFGGSSISFPNSPPPATYDTEEYWEYSILNDTSWEDQNFKVATSMTEDALAMTSYNAITNLNTFQILNYNVGNDNYDTKTFYVERTYDNNMFLNSCSTNVSLGDDLLMFGFHKEDIDGTKRGFVDVMEIDGDNLTPIQVLHSPVSESETGTRFGLSTYYNNGNLVITEDNPTTSNYYVYFYTNSGGTFEENVSRRITFNYGTHTPVNSGATTGVQMYEDKLKLRQETGFQYRIGVSPDLSTVAFPYYEDDGDERNLFTRIYEYDTSYTITDVDLDYRQDTDPTEDFWTPVPFYLDATNDMVVGTSSGVKNYNITTLSNSTSAFIFAINKDTVWTPQKLRYHGIEDDYPQFIESQKTAWSLSFGRINGGGSSYGSTVHLYNDNLYIGGRSYGDHYKTYKSFDPTRTEINSSNPSIDIMKPTNGVFEIGIVADYSIEHLGSHLFGDIAVPIPSASKIVSINQYWRSYYSPYRSLDLKMHIVKIPDLNVPTNTVGDGIMLPLQYMEVTVSNNTFGKYAPGVYDFQPIDWVYQGADFDETGYSNYYLSAFFGGSKNTGVSAYATTYLWIWASSLSSISASLTDMSSNYTTQISDSLQWASGDYVKLEGEPTLSFTTTNGAVVTAVLKTKTVTDNVIEKSDINGNVVLPMEITETKSLTITGNTDNYSDLYSIGDYLIGLVSDDYVNVIRTSDGVVVDTVSPGMPNTLYEMVSINNNRFVVRTTGTKGDITTNSYITVNDVVTEVDSITGSTIGENFSWGEDDSILITNTNIIAITNGIFGTPVPHNLDHGQSLKPLGGSYLVSVDIDDSLSYDRTYAKLFYMSTGYTLTLKDSTDMYESDGNVRNIISYKYHYKFDTYEPVSMIYTTYLFSINKVSEEFELISVYEFEHNSHNVSSDDANGLSIRVLDSGVYDLNANRIYSNIINIQQSNSGGTFTVLAQYSIDNGNNSLGRVAMNFDTEKFYHVEQTKFEEFTLSAVGGGD